MIDSLTFTCPGEPVPKGRARTALVGKGEKRVVRTYTPAETRAYEERVKVLCMAAVNMQRWMWAKSDRFEVEIVVYRTHEGAGGDLDNYAKAILDGINRVAFSDDRYVRRLAASLRVDATRPRVEVVVRRMRIGEALGDRRAG